MNRYLVLFFALLLSIFFLLFGNFESTWTWLGFLLSFSLTILGLWDFFQTRHSILSNYPILAHFRYLAERLRPEVHQYFIEGDLEGRPFDRDTRTLVYERAKDKNEEYPFGTEMDVYKSGYEWFNHSIVPKKCIESPFRVEVGGEQCKKPYSMALLNVSAMSFGSLSKNAIMALNQGAKFGNFAHDTGEGGLTEYHLKFGGDLVWEIGSGYFGCRKKDGNFDLNVFQEKSVDDRVKCISVKLSQGAKPGLGGVMPARKVSKEIAEIRGVPVGVKCVSPSSHKAFKTPIEFLHFIQSLREGCGGKPVGFKLCLGQRVEFLSICKAILHTGIFPDFIIVDGAEGGTGAAPLEFEDHVGTPLNDGLFVVHNALVGTGLRDKIRIGCSGKITSSFEMARRIAQGADYCNSARAMMFALGCIQAQLCQTNLCPVGVTTQDPKRVRALNVENKSQRVFKFQKNTVIGFNEMIAALGLNEPRELSPALLMKRISMTVAKPYSEIYSYLRPKELLEETPPSWKTDWGEASAMQFSARA